MGHLTIATGILMLATFLLTATVTIGIFQLILIMPQWFAHMPQSLSLINESNSSAIKFWIPLQILSFLSLIAALILNWGIPYRRTFILYTLGIYIIIAIISAAILAPQIISLSKINPNSSLTAEIASRGHNWLTYSWIRIGVLAIGNILLFLALAL